MRIIGALVLLCSIAHADPAWRVKVDSYASGELVTWPRHQCNAAINDQLRSVLLKHPYIELVDGTVSAGVGEKRLVRAELQTVTADRFEARYNVIVSGYAIVVTVRTKDARPGKDGKGGTVPVELSVIANGSACRETWLGYGKRL